MHGERLLQDEREMEKDEEKMFTHRHRDSLRIRRTRILWRLVCNNPMEG